MANKIADLRKTSPLINMYYLKQRDILSHGNSLIFKSYDKEWLEYVTLSRLGEKPWECYDYIEGGVADDRVVNTIRLYMGGYISAEETLK